MFHQHLGELIHESSASIYEVIPGHVCERDIRPRADVFNVGGGGIFGCNDRVLAHDQSIGVGADRFGIESCWPSTHRSAATAAAGANQQGALVVLNHRRKNICCRYREFVDQHNHRLGIDNRARRIVVHSRRTGLSELPAGRDRRGHSTVRAQCCLHLIDVGLIRIDNRLIRPRRLRIFKQRLKRVQAVLRCANFLSEKIKRVRNERSGNVQHVTAAAGISHDVHDQPIGVFLKIINLRSQFADSSGRVWRSEIRNPQVADRQIICRVRARVMKVGRGPAQSLDEIGWEAAAKNRDGRAYAINVRSDQIMCRELIVVEFVQGCQVVRLFRRLVRT